VTLAHNTDPGDGDCCPRCGSYDIEWETCYECGGDGELDCHDDDPINYAPDEEYNECQFCRGKGGWLVCHGCIAKAKEREAAK
jgi:hypothetical protein